MIDLFNSNFKNLHLIAWFMLNNNSFMQVFRCTKDVTSEIIYYKLLVPRCEIMKLQINSIFSPYTLSDSNQNVINLSKTEHQIIKY